MKTIWKITLVICLLANTISSTSAQEVKRKKINDTMSVKDEDPQNSKNRIIVEVDPLPYIWGGVGGHFGWTPKRSKHFAFGVGFIAGPKIPDAFINMEEQNKNQGWHLKINQGAALWTQYYFKQPNKGWFAGVQLITQEMKLTNDSFPGQSDRTNTLLISASTGYVLYPIRKIGLYLRPWAGIAYQKTIKATFEPDVVTSEMMIGNKEYYLTKVMPFATVHLGYRF